MAFINSIGCQVCVAQFDLTAYFNDLSPSANMAMLDSTVFGKTANTFQTGLGNGTLQASGFFDSTAIIGSDVVLAALRNAQASFIVSGAPAGFAIGNRAYMLQVLEKDYNLGVKVGALITNMASWQSIDGFDAGVSLHALAAETVSTNSASVDNAAATSNGGVAFIHVTAISGSPTVTIKVQHSTDNSTWADLVTFTALSAATSSERIVVAAGTTIRRYLRTISTFVGGTSPSITYTDSFARR